MSKYIYKRRILLQDTDTFGVVYFARFFDIASEAFENLLAESGLGIEKMDGNSAYVSPVSSADCKYVRPLKLGDQILVQVGLIKENDSAIKSKCEIYDTNSSLVAIVNITNTFVNKSTWQKISVPPAFDSIIG